MDASLPQSRTVLEVSPPTDDHFNHGPHRQMQLDYCLKTRQ